MKFFKKIFKHKEATPVNPYTCLGSVGVSPDKLFIYQDSVKLIKEFESKYK